MLAGLVVGFEPDGMGEEYSVGGTLPPVANKNNRIIVFKKSLEHFVLCAIIILLVPYTCIYCTLINKIYILYKEKLLNRNHNLKETSIKLLSEMDMPNKIILILWISDRKQRNRFIHLFRPSHPVRKKLTFVINNPIAFLFRNILCCGGVIKIINTSLR